MENYPGPTHTNLACFPKELVSYEQFVLWRGSLVCEAGKPDRVTKEPYRDSGDVFARTTDPRTWSTFERCVEALPTVLERWEEEGDPLYRGGGIGFVMTSTDPFCGIDFDHCVNPVTGVVDDAVERWIGALSSYAEYSQSGTGIHVMCQGSLPAGGRKKGSIELYDHSRFFAMTGWHLPETPATVNPAQPIVNALWCSLFAPTVGTHVWCTDEEGLAVNGEPFLVERITYAPDGEPYACFDIQGADWPLVRCTRALAVPAGKPTARSDEEVIREATNESSGPRFTRLFHGLWTNDYPSESEADMALCSFLSLWTQDAAQIDRLYRTSKLLDAKWDARRGSSTYGAQTIAKVLAAPRAKTGRLRVVRKPLPPAQEDVPDMFATMNGRVADPPLSPTESRELAAASKPETPLGDVYNAEALLTRYGALVRYCPPWKTWLTWQGTHWQRDTGDSAGGATLMHYGRETMRHIGSQGIRALDQILVKHYRKSMNHAPLAAMIRQASTMREVIVTPDQIDQPPMLLNCVNGTLDLTTGNLRPHERGEYLSKCLPTPYLPDATCPQWEAFLRHAMGGDTDPARATRLTRFLQRALGYSLTGNTMEQCFFLLYGTTKTGKSTFLHVVRSLLGPYASQAEMATFLHKDRDTVRNDLADLAGMRLVCAIETDKGKRIAMALMKQLTGGTDSIKARFLFEEYFEYRPQFKVFLAANDMPRADPDDAAFWERVKLVPFSVHIPTDERDKTLDTKLLDELPGILAWCVRGCLAWLKEGLGEPQEVYEAVKAYHEDNDTVQAFLASECVADKDESRYVTQSTVLYTAYKRWCDHSGEHAISQNAFGRTLNQRGYGIKTLDHNKKYRVGIGLMSQ